MASSREIYEEFGVNPKYDQTDSYGKRRSHFGNGKYPPDWDNRREAVWSLQSYQCARCGVYKGDVSGVAVHHVTHLSNGGNNKIENLAGLCQDCHALMHPDLDYVDGSYRRASLFPDPNALDDVAVIRWPSNNEELEQDLEHLSSSSKPDSNKEAITEATVPTSATEAKQAESELVDMLVERGFVPRITDYHSVEIDPEFTGIRGLVTRYKPKTRVKHDAVVKEADDWSGILNHKRKLRFTNDGTKATLEFEDGHGDSVRESVSFGQAGSETRISPVLSPPPLTSDTLPRYVLDSILFLSYAIPKRGVVPALLVMIFLPGLVPFKGILAGFLSLVLWFGILLMLPIVFKRMELR